MDSGEVRAMNSTVKQMKAYISEHLQESITLNDIAKAVGYSKYHAARIFKEETGLTLFEYIRQERLLACAHALRNRKGKIIDIAFDFVFDSHEGFTRAFANGFGITPKKFSAYPEPTGWRILYRYLDRQTKSEDLCMEQKTAVIFTQIMELPARKLILFRSKKATNYLEYCEEVGCFTKEKPDPWSILGTVKESLNEPMGVWLPRSMCPDGTGIYAHAIEVPVNYSGEIPEGFDVIELAPCKYMIFQGEPYDDDRYQEAIGAFWKHSPTWESRMEERKIE